jgi:hypothetical protein
LLGAWAAYETARSNSVAVPEWSTPASAAWPGSFTRREGPEPWKLIANQAAFVRRYPVPRPAGAPQHRRVAKAPITDDYLDS